MEDYVGCLSDSGELGGNILILITMGTQHQRFDRLIDAIFNYCCENDLQEEFIIQSTVNYNIKDRYENVTELTLIEPQVMNKYISDARLVITHGGTGSVLKPLGMDKVVIAAPRMLKYKEHLDNHQIELVESFVDAGYIIGYYENSKFEDIFKMAENFTPKKYVSNTEKFNRNMSKTIEGFSMKRGLR